LIIPEKGSEKTRLIKKRVRKGGTLFAGETIKFFQSKIYYVKTKSLDKQSTRNDLETRRATSFPRNVGVARSVGCKPWKAH
jgi:hypothetical protein